MKKLISILCLFCMAFSLLPAAALSASDSFVKITVVGETDAEKCGELLRRTNEVRAENGLQPLSADAALTKTAAIRAAEQSVVYGHTRPDGTKWTTSIAGISGASYAENLLWSSTDKMTAAEVLNVWMGSAGHRKNILTPEYASVGIGAFISGENLYFAVLFSSKVSVAPPTEDDFTAKTPIRADADKIDPVLTVSNAEPIETGDTISTTLYIRNREISQYGVTTMLDGSCYTVKSENGCVTISENGDATAVKAGEDILTAEILCENGRKCTASAAVTVTGESIVQPEIVTPEPLPFTDVDENAWYVEDVRFAYENGIMVGVGNGLFEPNGTLTREMFTMLLYNMEGSPAYVGENVFSDVNPAGWYADSVLWASEVGLVYGYGDDIFGVGDPLTREQMACLIARYAEYKGCALTERGDIELFADYEDISGYAREELSLLVGAGIINGVGGNRIDPQGTATRAQAAAIIHRIMTEML